MGAPRHITPLAVSDANAARMFDMKVSEFREAVNRGWLPPPVEIAPGIERWRYAEIKCIAIGIAPLWDLFFDSYDEIDWQVLLDQAMPIGKITRSGRSVAPWLREAVLQRDGYQCVYCGSTDGPLHMDHIYPFSRGGETNFENLCAACPTCNLSKGQKTPEEWKGDEPTPLYPSRPR